jgi:hypothetical protein
MAKLSPHRLKGQIIKIRRGVALYQTYASPFWFARILDPRTQRYKGPLYQGDQPCGSAEGG